MTELRTVPGSKEDLDPELISIRRRRFGVGPLLAGSVVLLCLYLVVGLRHDVAFSLRGTSPEALGDVAARLARGETLPDNRWVTLAVEPDRQTPGWLRGRQAIGYRIVPALGTSGKLWLRVSDIAVAEPPTYDRTHTGRIRPLDALPWSADLRRYIKSQPPGPRYLDARRLLDGPPTVDVAGDALTVPADSPVAVDVVAVGRSLVKVYRTDLVGSADAAQALLAAAGLAPSGVVGESPLSWSFEVPVAESAARDALVQARLFAANAEARVSRATGVWRDLVVDRAAGALRLGIGAAVPVADVHRLEVRVRRDVPDDAQVLLDGERPDAYWYTPILAGLLGLVCVLMVWAAVHSARRQRDDEELLRRHLHAVPPLES